ncbi:MAG TPA: HEPN domain-containing protein [Nitrospirae bacterium]|nr:HEPN domain protein [bacterium BMS3Abin06]HDH12662.1 HEPN domain-containing protein [Nitrospirota bacterium]HDY99970.1 HEPN domain-containing protein [Nitrospirota bacterium]
MKQHEVWLIKAENDLKSARRLSESSDPILDTAIYHTQQSAEKALKAYLAFKAQPIRKVHDIELLLESCSVFDKDFNQFVDDADILTPYNVAFRYPGPDIEPHGEEVADAIEKAEKILAFVKSRIK